MRPLHAEPVQLPAESWVLVYSDNDYDNANLSCEQMAKAGATFGVKLGDPEYLQVPFEFAKKFDGSGYVERLKQKDVKPWKNFKIVVVIIERDTNKKLIKAFLDSQGIPSQFILSNTVRRN